MSQQSAITDSSKSNPQKGNQNQDWWDFYKSKGFNYLLPLRINKRPDTRMLPKNEKGIGSWNLIYDNPEPPSDAQIARWKRYRNTRIGVFTGPKNDLCVFDADGEEALKELMDVLPGKRFNGPIVKTPTGGYHFYCRYSEEIGNTPNAGKSEHIDVKAEKGYVCAPPMYAEYTKKHPVMGEKTEYKGTYEWIKGLDDLPIPQVPQEWIDLILNSQPEKPLTLPQDSSKYEGLYPSGERHFILRKMGIAWKRQNFSDEDVKKKMLLLNTVCDPPKPTEEVVKLYESILEFCKNNPKEDLQEEATDTPLIIPSDTPILTSLDSIEPMLVRWLWPNRIPAGKLSLLVGDPGEGKSFLSIFIAACITKGTGWPDTEQPTRRGSVIIMTAEDGLADTVRIRADAAGADVSKIKILEGIRNRKGEIEFFNLDRHLSALEYAIKTTEDTRLIVTDPITAYLGLLDSHKNSLVRGILAPVAALAEKYGIAVLAISHMNKNTALDAIYRTMGSLAFVAAARAVWAISRDKKDETQSRRFLTPLKTNLSINPTTLAFRIYDTKVMFEDQPVEITAEDAISGERRDETSALGQAVQWLKEALEDGPIASNDIFRMAKENRISEITLRRAGDKLRVQRYKEGMANQGKWMWKLPIEILVLP